MEKNLAEARSFHTEWTPEEINGQDFRRSLFGFSRREVSDFLRLISKLWSRMIEHQQELEKEIAEWRSRKEELAEHKERALVEAQSIRDHARIEAEKLMAETEEKASAIRTRTEAWLEETLAKVDEMQRQKQNFLTAFRSALDSHYELIKTEEQDAEPLTAKLAGHFEALRKSAPM